MKDRKPDEPRNHDDSHEETLFGGPPLTHQEAFQRVQDVRPHLAKLADEKFPDGELKRRQAVWQEVFEQWDKPFLVAFTDADPITAGGEQTFLERVPTARNVRILGAGHFVQEDAGPELAQLMVDFMQGRDLPAEITIDTQ